MNTVALRLLKILVLLFAGLFGLFVFAGNLMDYNSNYQFVNHVLSMDTTFEGNALMWRAIDSGVLHTIAYWGLIIAEGVFSVLAFIGVYQMSKNLRAPGQTFNKAKSFGFYAFMLGFAIWFFGFIVIGSEWFAMWQSEIWNGKETAMDITTVWVGFAVLLALKDDDLE
jgi:predicted small integral membrane protein